MLLAGVSRRFFIDVSAFCCYDSSFSFPVYSVLFFFFLFSQ